MNEHNITYSTDRPIVIGNQSDESTEGNKLTIIGNGTISGYYGISVMGGNYKNTDKTYSTLVLGDTEGNSKINVTATGYYAVWGNGNHNGNGGDNCGTVITVNKGVTLDGGTGAGIYHPQTGVLNINGGTITGKTGIEIRAGSLTVNEDSNITSNSSTPITSHSNGNGSTSAGVGIAVVQHTTAQPITVNINGGEISGYTALAVNNPENNPAFGQKKYNKNDGKTVAYESTGTVVVNVTGGTLTSTSDDNESKAEEVDNGATDGNNQAVDLYTYKGRNAIFNADGRVDVSISNATISGNLAVISDGRTSENGGYTIDATNHPNFINTFTTPKDYSSFLSYTNSDVGYGLVVPEGWIYFNGWKGVVPGASGIGNAAVSIDGSASLSDLKYDATNKLFGVPQSVTSALTGSAEDYKLAKLAYDKNKTEVEITTDNAGAVIIAGSSSILEDTVKKIDASGISVAINITGDSIVKAITGGTGADSLTAGVAGVTLEGGEGADTLNGASLGGHTYNFSGGADVIKGYVDGDIVTLGTTIYPTEDGAKVTYNSNAKTFAVEFSTGNTLTFNEDVQASVKSDSDLYVYAKDSVAKNKGITLAAGHANAYSLVNKDFTTVDATKVSQAISLVGNTDANTIIGSSLESGGNSLNGGVGNDLLKGYGKGDVFIYTGKGGRDSIEGFSATDSLSVDTSAIKSGLKNNNRNLIFKIDSSNTITFTGDVEKVKLAGEENASLTKDGTIADNTLTLFADQKGKINLTDSVYSGITGIDASNVTNGIVTMIGGTAAGTFTFAKNKKADVFQYGGGEASLVGYVSDSDKIDLGEVSLSSFAVDSVNGVTLTLGDGKAISLQGSNFASKEVLIKDSENRSYKKYVFAETGVLYDKAKSPTTATLFNGAGTNNLYTAANSIKKINVSDNVTGISIQASSGNNTFIDASAAGESLTLVSNSKNDKFTGSAKADTFVYTAGKDVITNYQNTDNIKDIITLGGTFADSLGSAKITQSKKSVTLKFDNKNKLTIKAGSGNIGEIFIGGQEYTFGKNAIITGSTASLTSEYSGTYKVGSGVSTVDGSAVTKKNFTIQGTSGAESLVAGGSADKKTTLKGGGGADILVGGNSKDTFFYAKSDKGDAQVYNFDYANDQVKMKGTITGITKASDGLKFTTSGGSLTLKEDSKNNNIGSSNVLIKANNTIYWFATVDGNYGLYTSTNKEVKSDIKSVIRNQANYSIVDLNYSANLVKKGLATASETITFNASNYEKH